MMTGHVNADLEATIPLQLRGTSGRSIRVDAVIDTGFSAQLSLPIDRVNELELSWRKRESATLADGREVRVDVYLAEVMWDGHSRSVEVIATEVQPLVGMALLEEHVLSIEVVESGDVQINALGSHHTNV